MKIVSGMRPTGKLHIGHLFGALKNWIQLQESGHSCIFFVADWHALTTDFQKTKPIRSNIFDMLLDWLAAGINPEKSILFVQSQIKEHAELYLLLGMITPLGWLERNPTYKEIRQEMTDRDLSNLGFLGYPVLQAADILLYKGEAVPVGQDQIPHLELTREIVRRFNNFYGNIFPEPQPLLTSSPKINGLDGRKMSKSYGNAILISDTEKEIKTKIQTMVTDPKRARRMDPGNPDTCNFFPLHEVLSTQETIAQVRKGCTSAGIGCVDCKNLLLPSLLSSLKEIREKRLELEKSPKTIQSFLEEGTQKAQKIAQQTMKEINQAIHIE